MALPSGYTQLEYIEATGTQYINLGFVPGTNTKMVVDFQLTDTSANYAVFGVVGQYSLRWIYSGPYFRAVGGRTADFPTTIDGLARHTATKERNSCDIDGTTVTHTAAKSITKSLYLCAYNGGTSASAYAKVKIYSAKHYESDVLEGDYVPAKRDSDGVAGLYDLETDTFLTSDGTNDFVIGEPPAPEGGHACVIDGTVRQITGGKAMVGGTAYEISSGKTMVDGTVYEIMFTRPVSIEITSSVAGQNYGSSSYLYILINNETKIYQNGVYEAQKGDTLLFYAGRPNCIKNINLNGELVASANNRNVATFTMTQETDIKVVFSQSSSSGTYYHTIRITTL